MRMCVCVRVYTFLYSFVLHVCAVCICRICFSAAAAAADDNDDDYYGHLCKQFESTRMEWTQRKNNEVTQTTTQAIVIDMNIVVRAQNDYKLTSQRPVVYEMYSQTLRPLRE